jgi:hypothetical protein
MIQRKRLKVNGASGTDRDALNGVVVKVAFVYTGTTNASTNAEVFEQVGDYRATIATNDSSATNIAYPTQAESRDPTGTTTGNYLPPSVAGDVVLEVDSADADQVTEVYLWIV